MLSAAGWAGCVALPNGGTESDLRVSAVSRKSWQAQEAKPRGADPGQYVFRKEPVRYVTIHHTESDPRNLIGQKTGDEQLRAEEASLRAVQRFHIEQGYGDIAYHFLIGPSGTLYEGRNVGVTPASGTVYATESVWKPRENHFPDSGQLAVEGNGAKPGAVEGHLTICLLGDFRSSGEGKETPEYSPTTAAQETLVNTVARLLHVYHLTPDDVLVHREVANTSCPGEGLYRLVRGEQRYPGGSGSLMKEVWRQYSAESSNRSQWSNEALP